MSGMSGQLDPNIKITGNTDNTDIGNITDQLKTVDNLSSGLHGAQSVTTTAGELKVGASKLTNRKNVTMIPTAGTIYWGYTNAVTTTTGTPVFKNQYLEIATSASIWLIAASTQDVRITEGA